MRTLARRDRWPRIVARRNSERVARFVVMAYAVACFFVAAVAVAVSVWKK